MLPESMAPTLAKNGNTTSSLMEVGVIWSSWDLGHVRWSDVAFHRDFGVQSRSRHGSRVASFGVRGMASEMDPHVVSVVQPRIRLFVALFTR